jgi:hypothetical protein
MPHHLAIAHPSADEHAPYYSRYTSLVPGEDILAFLEQQGRDFSAWLGTRSEAEGDLRYAPDKWSVKEVVGHINDTERIFGYRALRFARNDATPIEGFEQDDYVANGPSASCSLAQITDEFRQVRSASLSLLRALDGDAWVRRGTANKNPISVRALAYVMAGHVIHHQKILQEKYFAA